MPDIALTDGFGLVVDFPPGSGSALLKYLRDPGAITATLKNAKPIQNLAVGDDPFSSLSAGLSFSPPISLGAVATELTITPELLGTVEVIKGPWLFDAGSDPGGLDVANSDPDHQAFVSVGVTAQVDAAVAPVAGSLQFSFEPSSSITLTNYRTFALTSPITDALRTLIQSFVIPRRLDDLESMAPGSVATVDGSGSFRFFATANLLSSVNPLATLGSIAGKTLLSIQEGASVQVGASVTVSGEYQLRVERRDGHTFRLSYEKKRSGELAVNASADVGVTATTGQFEIIHSVLQAVSGDPVPDETVFRRAGLTDGQIGSIAAALKCGIERSIELSIAGELDALSETSAGFSYEIDLDALSAAGRDALNQALGGNLSGFEGSPLVGVKPLQTVFQSLRQGNKILKINLLGVFNYASATDLFQRGTMIVDRECGDITVTDQAGADHVAFSAGNYYADPDKLRKVLAQSFLLTTAYRSSTTVPRAPELTSKYWFFQMHQQTSAAQLADYLNIAASLELAPAAPPKSALAVIPKGVAGRSTFYAESHYDETHATALFLDSGGNARPQSEYETLGRQALAMLLPPGDSINDARRLPLTDAAIWNAMSEAGQPNNFGAVFEEQGFNANQLADITSDYTLIKWWAAAMHAMGVALSALSDFVRHNPAWDPQDPAFKKKRSDLDSALAEVAATTKDQFAEPWGLLAMDLAAGGTAPASARIRCPQLNYDGSRA
jgi:hypothetical protein